MDYIGIPDREKYLEHYGRQGMHWYQHIFGDDSRWGKFGRAKGAKSKKKNKPGQARVDKAKAAYKKAKAANKAAKRRERAGSYNILTKGKFHNVRQFLANRKGGDQDNKYYKTRMKQAKAVRKATKERYGKKSAAYVKARQAHINARRDERAHSYHIMPGMALVRTFIANRSSGQNKTNKALYAKTKAAKKQAKVRLKAAKVAAKTARKRQNSRKK